MLTRVELHYPLESTNDPPAALGPSHRGAQSGGVTWPNDFCDLSGIHRESQGTHSATATLGAPKYNAPMRKRTVD